MADYSSRLHTVLRGFQGGHEALESWVHDEDLTESLVSMLESAQAYGLSGVTVTVRARAPLFEPNRIRSEAKHLGKVEVLPHQKGFDVCVEFGEAAAVRRSGLAKSPRVSRPFAENAPTTTRIGREGLDAPALARFRTQRNHEINTTAPAFPSAGLTVPAADGLAALVVAQDGVRLSVEVREAGTIFRASYGGAEGDTQAVLEALCAQIEGTPLRDAVDHAVKRLELQLRPNLFSRAVPGIQHGESSHPALTLAHNLLRSVAQSPLAERWLGSRENTWMPGVSPEWSALDEAHRLARLQAGLDDWCANEGHPAGTLHCVAIFRDVRLTVGLANTLPPAQKPEVLRRAEAWLKRHVEAGIVLYAAEATDKSPLRRL